MPANVRDRKVTLAVPGTFILPDLTDDGVGATQVRDLPERGLVSTYHDTVDLRLARAGVMLRHRAGDDAGPPWTLELPASPGDEAARAELRFAGTRRAPPPEALDLVTAFARSEKLGPVAALQTRRRRWLLSDAAGAELAELLDDEVSVLDGKQVIARFRELVLESRGPDSDALAPVADRLRRAGAVLAEPMPKAVRAMGPRAAAPPDLVTRQVQPADSAGVVVQAAIAAGAIRLTQHDPWTRRGDAEALHQMRVAARRLRSDVRTFAPLVEAAWAHSLSDELSWLGERLGAVRDLDVQVGGLEEAAADLRPDLGPLFEQLAVQRDAARSVLLEALRSDRYTALLDGLVDAARQPRLTAAAEAAAAEALTPLLHRAWRRLERRAAVITADDPDERYHAVRILAKRARYAGEAIGPALGARGKSARAFASRAAALQEQLGLLQDAVIAADLIRSASEASRKPRFTMAAGRLYERQQLARERARARYPKAWRRVARSGERLSREA